MDPALQFLVELIARCVVGFFSPLFAFDVIYSVLQVTVSQGKKKKNPQKLKKHSSSDVQKTSRRFKEEENSE